MSTGLWPLKRIPTVKSVMSPFPYSIAAEASPTDARSMMREHGIRHLPVMHESRLVGVVSTRDLQTAICQPAFLVDLSERLDDVLLRMADEHIRCALATKQGRLAGIVTVTDICRRFGEHLRALFPEDDGDTAA